MVCLPETIVGLFDQLVGFSNLFLGLPDLLIGLLDQFIGLPDLFVGLLDRAVGFVRPLNDLRADLDVWRPLEFSGHQQRPREVCLWRTRLEAAVVMSFTKGRWLRSVRV